MTKGGTGWKIIVKNLHMRSYQLFFTFAVFSAILFFMLSIDDAKLTSRYCADALDSWQEDVGKHKLVEFAECSFLEKLVVKFNYLDWTNVQNPHVKLSRSITCTDDRSRSECDKFVAAAARDDWQRWWNWMCGGRCCMLG